MPDRRLPIPTDGCERQLLAFADALPIGTVLLDGPRILALNAAAAAQLGVEARDLVGERVERLFADAIDALSLPAPGDVADAAQHLLRRSDGSTLRARIGLRAIPFGSSEATLMFICDLSENERIRAQLARQHDELQAMARRLLGVQEDERRTLSRELHDDIGQQITAIKLGAIALQGDDDGARREEILAEIIAITDQTVAKVRNLSLLLRPPQLDELGLEAALRWQAGAMFRGAAPRLELGIEPLVKRAPPAVELACFRIAQEALTNVLRHANAREVRLHLAQQGDQLVLEVCDDGDGFAGSESAGLGLVTMRERAQQIGGRLEVVSDPLRGTRVCAALPLQRAPGPEPIGQAPVPCAASGQRRTADEDRDPA